MINLDNIKQTVVDKFLGLVYGDQMTTEAYQLGKVVAQTATPDLPIVPLLGISLQF